MSRTSEILRSYIAGLTALDDDPRVSLDRVARSSRRLELAQTCLQALNGERTEEIVGLLNNAVVALGEERGEEASLGSRDGLRRRLARSSRPLSELLGEQLISSEEHPLYQVCRVAWDHVHVGERLLELMEEVERKEEEVRFDSRVQEISRGLRFLAQTASSSSVSSACLRPGPSSESGKNRSGHAIHGVNGGHAETDGDEEWERVLNEDVVGNLVAIIQQGDVQQEGTHSRGQIDIVCELEQQTKEIIVDLALRCIRFEKGGLPKADKRLHVLLRAALSLGFQDDVGKSLADLIFKESIRKVWSPLEMPQSTPWGKERRCS
jgi:hypothetical protein